MKWGGYKEALITRIKDDIGPQFEPIIRKHVTDILGEIQHRMYQDGLALLMDLARDINPAGRRSP